MSQLFLSDLITEACELFAPTDAPTHYFTAAQKHALAFRRKLIGGTSRENRTQVLELGNDRTVDLPDDYVQYERLGVLSENQQYVHTLAYADISPMPVANVKIDPSCWPHDWMRFGGFKIDNAKRQIICNSLVPQNTLLVLEYKCYGAAFGEDIPIDPLAHSWGVKYILAELHGQKKDWVSAREVAKDREREFALYKQAISNFSLTGAMQVKHQTAAQLWK